MTSASPLLSAPAVPTLSVGEIWEWAIGAPLRILGIALAAVVVRWLLHRAINRIVQETTERSARRRDTSLPSRASLVLVQAAGMDHERRRQRTLTLGSLLRNIATVVVFSVALLTILAELGISMAPLLASAGIGGVAIGFGAQSLVKDFLSGIFMIIEDQYGVGDMIDAGEAVGTVEEVTLRVTRLRDPSGVVWFLRNGEILRIGNMSQGWATATVDIAAAYDEDVAKVLGVMREVVARMYAEEPWRSKLLEEPTVAGVESVSGGTMTLRIFATCQPGEQYAVPRELRERVKVAFDQAGIRGPQILPYGRPEQG